MFGDIEIRSEKNPTFLGDVDIENVSVSNKIYSDEKNYKYFIGYLYNDYNIKPLHMFPKTRAYVKS